MKDHNGFSKVRDQYEDYPYPARNPYDEKKYLHRIYLDCLDRINHYCHSGLNDFSAGARILVAGGGTGDSTIFFAEQLRDTDSEIVYLDFSKASMDVARQRAAIRGLDNITWIQDSLLDISPLKLGMFDHISCTGVLHHLENPLEGLAALKSVLDDEGSITLMVYALYGRTAVYQVQELMKLITQNEPDMQVKVHDTRKVLDALPTGHWYHWSNPDDMIMPDIELYDRFLHSQDRAYTIPQLHDFVESAGLKVSHLFDQREMTGDSLYKPAFYIRDHKLLARIQALDIKEQQAIAELLNGRITQHSFYAATNTPPLPDPEMLDNIPALTIRARKNVYDLLIQQVCAGGEAVTFSLPTTKADFTLQKTEHMEEFFRHMDGLKTLEEIYNLIIFRNWQNNKQISHASLSYEFREMISTMTAHNQLHFRHKSVPAYRTSEEIQARMS